MRTPLLCLALLAPAVGLSFSGCKADPVADERPPIKRPDEPRALQYALEDHLLVAATAGDAAKVRGLLEGYLATPADFDAVFAERGPALYAAYKAHIVPKFLEEAPAQIIARAKEGYTEVKVRIVGPVLPEFTVPGDQTTLDAMAKKQQMMSVWIHPPGQELGLRLEGWLYREGRWLTVLKLHREITRLAAEAKAAEAKAAEEAKAADGGAPSEGAADPD